MTRLWLTIFAFCVCVNIVTAQNLKNLTVYDAGVAEITDERSFDLQTGNNQIEWRGVMPKIDLRTLRVTAENATVTRQDVTFDGADVRNEKTAVLHLTLQNNGGNGRQKVSIDYLAANLAWQNNYSLTLDATTNGAQTIPAALDSWVSLLNKTGVDVNADAVDLIAGEIALLDESGNSQNEYAAQVSSYRERDTGSLAEPLSSPTVSKISAFTRFRLGNNISLTANKLVSRFPLFQRARATMTQRNVFENEYGTQTLGRGGFVLLPRGLEVRLIGKNPTTNSMPAGAVTIYARSNNDLPQIVGQDRVQLTPPNGEFTVAQGRSSTLFGTRRILERRSSYYQNEKNNNENQLTTKIEIVIANRAAFPAEIYVRENIEPYSQNSWQILESSIGTDKWQKLGTNAIQTNLTVAANSQTTITYTVQTR